MPSTTPAAKMRSGHYFDFMEQNDKFVHRNCTIHGYSRRSTRSTMFIVRVKSLGPGWCGICREGCWGGSFWSGMDREGIARTGVEKYNIVQVVFERHQEDRRVMDDCRYSRGRSVLLGRWLEPPSYPVENKTKSDLTTRKICVPLVPVDNLSCV